MGVSERMYREYVARGLPPESTTEEAFEWKRLNVEPRRSLAVNPADISEAKYEKTKWEAALLQLKFQQESGLLVSAEEVQRAQSQACAKAKNRLELLPHEVVRDFPQELRQELFERVELAVRAVLLDLSETSAE